MKQVAKIGLVVFLVLAVLPIAGCCEKGGMTIISCEDSGTLTDIHFYDANHAQVTFCCNRGHLVYRLAILDGYGERTHSYTLGREYYLYLVKDWETSYILSPKKLTIGQKVLPICKVKEA